MSSSEGLPTVPTTVDAASWGSRAVAAILDGLIVFMPAVLASQFIVQGGGIVLMIVYFVYLTGSKGQTFGKRAMQLKVIKTDGRQVEFGTAALREILGKFVSGIILLIGFLWPLWDPRKQALHDKIATTLVVRVLR